MSEHAKPTLELERAPWTARSEAQRLGLVGDWSALFRKLLDPSALSSGSARVLGLDVSVALRSGRVGFAPCDPPWPDTFSVREYLEHAARLAHGSRSRAESEARAALDRFGLAELGPRRMELLVLHQRRALGVALAKLGSPELCLIEAPLRGLDAPAADYLTRLVNEAARGTRLIVSAAIPSTPSPERALLDACDELLVALNGELLAQGPPSRVLAPTGRYLLTVSGERVAELVSALRAAGCELWPRGASGSFAVALPAQTSTDLLLDSALDAGLVVRELEPVLFAQSAVGSGLAAL